jgi:hypothetical protein
MEVFVDEFYLCNTDETHHTGFILSVAVRKEGSPGL